MRSCQVSNQTSSAPPSSGSEGLGAVLQLSFAGGTRAMNAAEDFAVGFYTVTDDPAVAMRTNRCQRVDRAFEAIECVVLSGYDHFERLVIFILANFACSHT